MINENLISNMVRQLTDIWGVFPSAILQFEQLNEKTLLMTIKVLTKEKILSTSFAVHDNEILSIDNKRQLKNLIEQHSEELFKKLK